TASACHALEEPPGRARTDIPSILLARDPLARGQAYGEREGEVDHADGIDRSGWISLQVKGEVHTRSDPPAVPFRGDDARMDYGERKAGAVQGGCGIFRVMD